MEQMTPTQILSGYFPETKKQQISFVEQLIDHVLNGWTDPLKAESQIKNVEDVVKAYRGDKRVKEAVIDAFEKKFPGQKTAQAHNAEFKITEVGVKYDYENCNDPVWVKLTEKIKELTEQRKQREDVLKANRSPWEYVDTDTGETFTINPSVRTSTTQVTVTIK